MGTEMLERQEPAAFPDIPDPDEEEELTELYSSGKVTGIVGTQAAVCGLIAAGLLILHSFQPETARELLDRLKELAGDGRELIPDPIGLLISLCGR
ncbi:MAG TPA: hypothetical protein PLY43_09855 [Ruminococcus sp.]|nr:hypothetical protein [Ruminococcus sp.]